MAYAWFSSLGVKAFSIAGGGGATTGLTDRKLIDTGGGTEATFVTTPVAPGCEVSWKIPAAAAGGEAFTRAFSSNVATMGCWVRFTGDLTPSAAARLLVFGTSNHTVRMNTAGMLQVGANATTYVDIFTPTTDTWYWVSFGVDCSSNPHTADCKVYDSSGTLVGNASDTAALAAATQLTAGWGTAAAASGLEIYYGCPMLKDDYSSHPLARHGATILTPTGQGTHSPGSGAFQDAGANAITNAGDSSTQSWLDIDEAPPSGSDYVRQTVDDANGYLEYSFSDVRTDNSLGVPQLVQLLGALYPSTTGANLCQQRLNDGGTITAEATLDASQAANTVEYRLHGYTAKPSTGSWDTTTVNALKARIGYMTLQPAQAGWAALYIESLHLVAADVTVAGVVGTGSAVGVVPVISETVAAPCGTASGVGIAPAISTSTEFYTDGFERTVAAGTTYGTADVGGAYTAYTTTVGTGVSVSSGAGRVNPSAVPKTYHQCLNSATGTDVKIWALVSFSTLATGASQEISVFCRSDTGADNYYAADFEQLTDGTCRLSIEKNTVGARSDIVAPLSMGSYGSADTKWWVELIVVGNALEARAWADGGTRPSTADRSGTDSSFTSSGNVGLRSRVATSNSNAAEFRWWEAHAQPATVSDVTITGVVGTGSGAGVVPTIKSTEIAPVGTGSGVGVAPTTGATPPAAVPVGTGSGAGVVPTIKSTEIAPVGTGSGVGVVPTLPLLLVGVVGTGSGAGVVPTLKATEIAPVGTGSGVGVVPVAGQVVVGVVGTGSAVGVVPTIKSTLIAPVGTGSGVGVVPAVVPPVTAPVGTGTAAGVVPTIKATIVAVVATGSGAGVVPTVVGPVVGVVGTGSGAGVVPVIKSTIIVGVATGTGTGLVPSLPVIVSGAGTGTGAGVVPGLAATMIAPAGLGSGVGVVAVLTAPAVGGFASCYTPDYGVASIIGASGGTTAAADRRLSQAIVGTPTFVADSIDTGRSAIRIDSTSAASSIDLALPGGYGTRYSGGLCRFKYVGAAFASGVIARLRCSTGTENILIRTNITTGVIAYSFNNGSSYTNSSASINLNQVYRLEFFCDWGVGTSHTLKVKLDGVEIINASGGTASVTAAEVSFGSTSTVANLIVDYADLVSYGDVAGYGLVSDWRVWLLSPTLDGTHSMTANDFQDNASTNLTNASTGTYTRLDEIPPTTSDFVKQVVSRSTSYMEYVMGTISDAAATTPRLVRLVLAHHPIAAATSRNTAFRLNSNGNLSTEAVLATSNTADTLEYRTHHYGSEPVTSWAWSLPMVNALRTRIGYSTDVIPVTAFDAIHLMVVTDYQEGLGVAPVGLGSGVGFAPTLIGPAVAPVGTGSGVGVTPTVKATLTAPVATGSGVGVAPTIKGAEVSPVGTGTGVGVVPTVKATLTAPVGTGSGVGRVPGLVGPVVAVVGTGTGVGFAPTVLIGQIVVPPVGLGTGVGIAPTLLTVSAAPYGVGTGSGVTPSLLVTVAVSVGLGAASGFAPTLTIVQRFVFAKPVGNSPTETAMGNAPTQSDTLANSPYEERSP